MQYIRNIFYFVSTFKHLNLLLLFYYWICTLKTCAEQSAAAENIVTKSTLTVTKRNVTQRSCQRRLIRVQGQLLWKELKSQVGPDRHPHLGTGAIQRYQVFIVLKENHFASDRPVSSSLCLVNFHLILCFGRTSLVDLHLPLIWNFGITRKDKNCQWKNLTPMTNEMVDVGKKTISVLMMVLEQRWSSVKSHKQKGLRAKS